MWKKKKASKTFPCGGVKKNGSLVGGEKPSLVQEKSTDTGRIDLGHDSTERKRGGGPEGGGAWAVVAGRPTPGSSLATGGGARAAEGGVRHKQSPDGATEKATRGCPTHPPHKGGGAHHAP